jgi:zinc protease
MTRGYRKYITFSLLLLLTLHSHPGRSEGYGTGDAVTRATLSNGMQVVILQNSMAPLVAVQMNVLVGGNDSPAGFPGTAHAQEHMAFRGCSGMTTEQTAAIYAQLGDESNAETRQSTTVYYATVPATDLDVALQAQSMCLRGIDDSQSGWEQERGAIEQEVAEDLSDPTYAFLNRVNEDMFAGTPYAMDALGTKASFDATTGPMLKDFYEKWYTPGNAILVIVGDVNPAETLTTIKRLFGDIPGHALPTRPAIKLGRVISESLNYRSNLSRVLGFVALRLPGSDSPDYAATLILADVLDSQRSDLYGMVAAGTALDVRFELEEIYPVASVGLGSIILPTGTTASSAMKIVRHTLHKYAVRGVPEDLVAAAKRGEIMQAIFDRSSISSLADIWSNALAAEGRASPDVDIDAIRRVTVADVNRVAREYLWNPNVVTAAVTPVPTGKPVASKGFGGTEKLAKAFSEPVRLPLWAAGALEQLHVPDHYLSISDTALGNGIRLIVRTDATSPTITLLGSIKHDADMQTPAGKEGISGLLDDLYSYGTQTMSSTAFQKALDDIAASEKAGYEFALTVSRQDFSRGIQLLADNELHPLFHRNAFAVIKRRALQSVTDDLRSADYAASRALDLALLPSNDPTLREATAATLSKITLDDIKRFHAATVRPDLTTIVLVGNISPEEARTVIDQYFGKWQALGVKPDISLPHVGLNQPSAMKVIDREHGQDSVILSEEVPLDRFSPDYYALQLGNSILGDGFYGTRLYRDLRESTGYVYSVDVNLQASGSRATYSINYACSPENVSKARALVERDIDQMRSEDISASELHQAKALLLRRLLLDESSEDALARGLLDRADIGLPLDEPIRTARRYLQLNAEDIRSAFSRAISPSHLVQVVQGPPPK